MWWGRWPGCGGACGVPQGPQRGGFGVQGGDEFFDGLPGRQERAVQHGCDVAGTEVGVVAYRGGRRLCGRQVQAAQRGGRRRARSPRPARGRRRTAGPARRVRLSVRQRADLPETAGRSCGPVPSSGSSRGRRPQWACAVPRRASPRRSYARRRRRHQGRWEQQLLQPGQHLVHGYRMSAVSLAPGAISRRLAYYRKEDQQLQGVATSELAPERHRSQ